MLRRFHLQCRSGGSLRRSRLGSGWGNVPHHDPSGMDGFTTWHILAHAYGIAVETGFIKTHTCGISGRNLRRLLHDSQGSKSSLTGYLIEIALQKDDLHRRRSMIDESYF